MSSLQSAIRAQLQETWLTSLRLDTHRMKTVGPHRSHLQNRSHLPRNIQTTYSQWRCGEILQIGPYPRRLGLMHHPECRWCQGLVETAHHLLTECPAVASYRERHRLSLKTLQSDTDEGAQAIYAFQQHLLAILPIPLAQPPHGRARRREEGDDNVPPTARRRLNSDGAVNRGRPGGPETKKPKLCKATRRPPKRWTHTD